MDGASTTISRRIRRLWSTLNCSGLCHRDIECTSGCGLWCSCFGSGIGEVGQEICISAQCWIGLLIRPISQGYD